MITIYGIKNCDSVKKAFRFFNDHALEYNFIDFKTSPVDKNKITQWSQKGLLPLLLNTKGTTYRNLELKTLTLTDNEKVEWMTKENLLIKRPVVEYGANVLIGFNPTQYEGIFLS